MLSVLAVFALILAGLLFGSQFVPQKFCLSFDFRAYNLSMIIGIALVATMMAGFSVVLPSIPGNVSEIEFEAQYALLGILAGVIWSLGNFFILSAVTKIGISRTFPVVNLLVVVAFFNGIILLGELSKVNYLITVLLLLSMAGVLVGSYLVSMATSREEKEAKDVKGGLMAAALSALFFGLYNVPILISLDSEAWSPYLAMFFLSIGALMGAVFFGFIWLGGRIFSIWRVAGKRKHVLAFSGGIVWGLGQLFAIIGMTYVGMAIATPILQGIVIVVGAVWGLAVFKELGEIPVLRRKKALLFLLLGCACAFMGSVFIGYIASLIY